MITEYITVSGDQINITHAKSIYAGKVCNAGNPKDFQHAVMCDIGRQTYILAYADSRERAVFHANSIKMDIKLAEAG